MSVELKKSFDETDRSDTFETIRTVHAAHEVLVLIILYRHLHVILPYLSASLYYWTM